MYVCIFSYLLHKWYVCNPISNDRTIFEASLLQQLNITYYSINSTNAHHTLEALTVCMSSTVLIVV